MELTFSRGVLFTCVGICQELKTRAKSNIFRTPFW